MGETILVLGGTRSGKSRLAERLASERGPVTYLATATLDPADPEMAARVARHRAGRPVDWTTHEAPRDVAGVLAGLTAGGGSVVVDSVTLWLGNLLLGIGGPELGDDAILGEVDRGAGAARVCEARVVWVSDEVGSGGVAGNALARRFNDVLGLANQRLAAAADAVHLSVAGLALRLK